MSYLGAKSNSGSYQKIIALMPKHDVYIEPFLGTGSVFRNKPPVSINIANDLNVAIIDKYDYPAGTILSTQDALTLIAEYDYTGQDVLIYLDPPYLSETRTSNSRYEFEFSYDQHVQLLTLIKQIPAKVIISGYRAQLYLTMLDQWNIKQFQSMTRGGVRQEYLWYNFKPDNTFWHTYAGKDFTDRQRIKRKAERWSNDFKTLPQFEQLAILNKILY